MKLVGVFSCVIIFCSCSSGQNENKIAQSDSTKTPLIITDSVITETTDTLIRANYTSEVFETTGLGWGYKIFENGTLFINQPHIPAIQGNKGFSSKEKAQLTADFAIQKMNEGFIPPTISTKELDSLGVL